MAMYKNQHYVPQTYLRNFTSDSNRKMIWVIDKEDKDINTIKLRSIKNTCAKQFYYSHKNTDNSWDHSVELSLGKYEMSFSNLSKKLIQQSIISSSQKTPILEVSELNLIYEFVLLLSLRNPIHLDPILNILLQEFQEINRRHQIQEPSETTLNFIKQSFIPGFLSFDTGSLARLLPLLKTKNINIVTIPLHINAKFITSDTPVVVTNPNQPNALIEPETEYFLPISSRIAISIYGNNTKPIFFQCHSIKKISYINELIAQQAKRFIISEREVELRNMLMTLGHQVA